MKVRFYVAVNAQSNGDHEVHMKNCLFLPLPDNRVDLGEFNYCNDAIRQAQFHYERVNGCKFCCEPCHTS